MASDVEIIAGCKKGNPGAQKLLYIRHAPFLKGVCLRYIKDRDAVSDVLQDAFMKIFSNIKNLKEESALEGWLRRIVVNTCLDYLKKTKLKGEQSIDESDISLVDGGNEASDESIVQKIMEAGFSKEILISLLDELPEQYSRAFNMFYIDDMSHRDIAEIFNIQESLSRKWVFRAKDLVKKSLEDHLLENRNTWKLKIK